MSPSLPGYWDWVWYLSELPEVDSTSKIALDDNIMVTSYNDMSLLLTENNLQWFHIYYAGNI